MNRLLVAGVGGAGWAVAQQVHGLTGGRLLALNSDHEVSVKTPKDNRLLVSEQILAEENPLEMFKHDLDGHFADVQQLVVTVGLGGVTGTKIAPLLVQIATAKRIDVCVAVTLPFSFEESRRPIAETTLNAMTKIGVPIFVYDHESAIIEEATPSLIAAFDLAKETLAKGIFAYIRTK